MARRKPPAGATPAVDPAGSEGVTRVTDRPEFEGAHRVTDDLDIEGATRVTDLPPDEPQPRDRARLVTYIERRFGAGTYLLWLDLPRAAAIERAADCGLMKVAGDVFTGRIHGADGGGAMTHGIVSPRILIEVVRQALIGGGRGMVDGEVVKVDPQEAASLLEFYGPPSRPVSELWDIATIILYAAVQGVEPPDAPLFDPPDGFRVPPAR